MACCRIRLPGHLRFVFNPIAEIPITFSAYQMRHLFMRAFFPIMNIWRQMHPFTNLARKRSLAVESRAPISQPSQRPLAVLVDGSYASQVNVQRAWWAYRHAQVFGGRTLDAPGQFEGDPGAVTNYRKHEHNADRANSLPESVPLPISTQGVSEVGTSNSRPNCPCADIRPNVGTFAVQL